MARDTTSEATAKFVRVSPRKARLVADHIRGRSVPEARTILAFTERAAAIDVEKVLRSRGRERRVEPGLHWNGDDLVVHAVFVDEGPTLKRWRARARGRVARINKRTCHITIRSTARGRGRRACSRSQAEADAQEEGEAADGTEGSSRRPARRRHP